MKMKRILLFCWLQVVLGWMAYAQIDLALNLQSISQEELVSKVLCFDQTDSLVFSFDMAKSGFVPDSLIDSNFSYVWQGVSIWAQLNMAQPVRIARLPDQEGPYLILPQQYFNKTQLPPDQQTIRLTVRIRRVLVVEGNQVKNIYRIAPGKQDFLFSIVRDCEG